MDANSHPVKVTQVADEGFYANSHPYKVVIVGGGGGGQEGRVVDELPETGEAGYIYLVLKEESEEGDIYDEYMWVLQEDGETYGWEHIGATNEVTVKLYDTALGTNTDGAPTQKAVADSLFYSYETQGSKFPVIGTGNTCALSNYAGNIGTVIGDNNRTANGSNIVIGKGVYASGQSVVLGQPRHYWTTDDYTGSSPITQSVFIGFNNNNNTRIGQNSVIIGGGLFNFPNEVGYGSVAIGSGASPSSGTSQTQNVAIGYNAKAAGYNASVALGSFSMCSRSGEVNVGLHSSGAGHGYNGTDYRVIGGVHDPELPQDAATKNYVDTAVASAGGGTVLTNAEFNNLWENA